MREDVQDYYGKQLQSSADLQTNACCDQAPPEHLKPLLARLHDEVVSRYYGCGLVAPEQLQGMRILDLGSGSGRDVYLLSALVGEQGEVVGVDMTVDEALKFLMSGGVIGRDPDRAPRTPRLPWDAQPSERLPAGDPPGED